MDWQDWDPLKALMLRLDLPKRWLVLPLGFEQLYVVQQMGHSMQSAMGVPGRSGQSLKNIIISMFICAHALVQS